MRLVVFDVDGTLVDSQAHIVSAMHAAFAALGQPAPDRATCLSVVGLSLPLAMARLAPQADQQGLARLVEGYKGAFAALRPDMISPLYPGALDVLARLEDQEDLLLGIATGKSRRGLTHILDAYGLKRRFVTVQVADDHPSKPHPSMLQVCLAETGVRAQDAVMVGDTVFDMDMARNAGLHGVGVSWGYHAAAELGPRVIDDFAQLDGALHLIWAGGQA